MKKNSYFLLLCLIITQLSIAQPEELSDMSGADVFAKVVQYYDPDDSWQTYTGSIHLNTIWPDGRLGSEDIYLDNANELYQSVSYRADSILIRKWEENVVTYSLNGRNDLSDAVRNQLKLGEQDIQFLKRRHLTEVGWPMQMKALEVIFNPVVKKVQFNDKNCLLVESIGTPQASKAKYPLLQNSIFYYINQADFSLEGMEFPLAVKSQNMPPLRVIFNQDMEVNGIKIPRVKTYYNLDTEEYLYSTSANEFTRKPFVDIEEEKNKIIDVLAAETYYFEQRNFAEWADTWSHKSDVVHCFVSKEEGNRIEGWENVKQFGQALFKKYPEPATTSMIERDNFVYHIYEKIAWVYFDSKERTSQGRHQRILRKEHGQWKLISVWGVDESSY